MPTGGHSTRIARPLALARPAVVLALASVLAAAPLGCRGDRSDKRPRQFFPDMDDSPKFKPQTRTDFFADGRAARPPVDGTVAFGPFPFASQTVGTREWSGAFLAERADALGTDSVRVVGLTASGQYVERIPIAVDASLLERGAERFNIYCAACHGYGGDGQGAVGVRWAAPVPSFLDPKYADASLDTGKDGYLFHIARNGLQHPDGRYRMPGYGHALSVRDTWAVVAHIRALQESADNEIDDLPEGERRRLLDEQGRAAAPAADGGRRVADRQGGGR